MNKYKNLTHEQLEEHFANYLIDSWSYSKVSSFSRNEKDFEMQYVYGEGKKQSASSVAGKAYHAALEKYFTNKKEHNYTMDMVELELMAFAYIENTPADAWKLQKSTPTVLDCIATACKSVSQFLNNFLSEIQVYESETAEILGIEERLVVWIRVNGVDIPLPCHLVIDEIIRTNDGKVVIIDHKSKKSFTDENEIRFVVGKQAITYVLGYEEATGIHVDEVWFVENKGPKNKDNSPQVVAFKCIMDHDTRRLYEALLYEPLKRMIEAVNNPDYLYLINDSDNMIDKAELYEFWAKTMVAELDSFNIPDNKKPMIEERLRKIRNAGLATASPNVIKNFKKFAAQFIPFDLSNKDMTNQEKIEYVLTSFGTRAQVKHSFEGYSSTSYLLEVAAGVSIASIQKYKLDIANALNVSNVRIQKDLVVYEGKSYLSVESSKKATDTLFWDSSKMNGNKIPLGIDNYKQTVVWDLDNNSTPHMLVCGATGCLAADTNITIYVPHYKRKNKTKTIETLFKIQNGAPNKQTHLVNKNKKDMLVRCLDEKTNKFTYTPFEVVYSGKKQCFVMKTDAGQEIECTADHKFLSASGWKPLYDLVIGEKIMYRPSVRKFEGKQKQLAINDAFVKYHPKGRSKTIIDRTSGKSYKYYRVPLHHLIYEANKNGLSVENYRELLNNYDGRELFFIPVGFQIDHIDGDRENNDPSNLQMLTIGDHARKTADTAIGVFGYFQPKECSVQSIIPSEIKDTYDICCIGDNHNFLANNLVVHNSGKSVFLNSTINFAEPVVQDIYLFDPKYEFTEYKSVPGFTVVNDIEEIETQLALLVIEMEERVKTGSTKRTLVVFDEFADAVANSRKGNELNNYIEVVDKILKDGTPRMKRIVGSVDRSLEENLRVLLQKGRSSGFRIIAATQRASVKVITGDAKVNFPVQVCFRVPKDIDSIVVIDEPGAEALNGRGDGLIKSPEYLGVVRFQAFYKAS